MDRRSGEVFGNKLVFVAPLCHVTFEVYGLEKEKYMHTQFGCSFVL